MQVRAAYGPGAFSLLPRSWAVPEDVGDWLRWLKDNKAADTGAMRRRLVHEGRVVPGAWRNTTHTDCATVRLLIVATLVGES